MTELFLKKKGDPNLYSECDSKLTPLHIACLYGRKNIVELLLKNNPDGLDLKCNEGLTPILYAMQENHFEVIDVIRNFIFEQKIEKKKRELALGSQNTKEVPKTPRNDYNNEGTPIKNALTNALQKIEQDKFTPNRINYNFDVTSPYYINITHRRHRTSRKLDLSESKALEEEKTEDICNEKKNLFELTEENVKAFSKLMNNPIVVERIAIHKRKSYIAAWREKIHQIQKDDKFDYSYINYLNTCNDVTLVNRPDESVKESIVEISSSSDNSFHSANSDLQRNDNIVKNKAYYAPQQSIEYIENFEEDYVHSDVENGIMLYEKKLISKSREMLNRMNECAITDSSLSSANVTLPPLDYDTDTLRMELKKFGQDTGPITKTTKKLYLKKLVKFQRNPARLGAVRENNSCIGM